MSECYRGMNATLKITIANKNNTTLRHMGITNGVFWFLVAIVIIGNVTPRVRL